MTQSGSLDKPQRNFSQITTQLAWRRSRPVRAPWSFSISSCLRLRLTYRIFVIVNKNHKTHRIGPKHVCVCVYIHCCEFTFKQLIQRHQNLKQMHFLLLPQIYTTTVCQRRRFSSAHSKSLETKYHTKYV